jgi:hypothetical protein
MKNEYFEIRILPYLEKRTETDSTDLKWLRQRWRAFEKIPGIQTLINAEDHESVCKIFDLAN